AGYYRRRRSFFLARQPVGGFLHAIFWVVACIRCWRNATAVNQTWQRDRDAPLASGVARQSWRALHLCAHGGGNAAREHRRCRTEDWSGNIQMRWYVPLRRRQARSLRSPYAHRGGRDGRSVSRPRYAPRPRWSSLIRVPREAPLMARIGKFAAC